MPVLKLFSDKGPLPKEMKHVPMLYPFWGEFPEYITDPQRGAFDRYLTVGHSLFQMTSIEDADFAVMPADWRLINQNELARKLADGFIEAANNIGKRVIIFFWSDSDEEIPLNNTIIFRTSLYECSRKANEFALPFWNEDIVERYFGNDLPVRQKRAKPIIGFCGLAAPSSILLRQNLKDFFYKSASHIGLIGKSQLPFKLGHIIRSKALATLSKSQAVTTNFIVRDKFYAGAVSLSDGVWNFDLKQKVRREYLRNMWESDYILCVRGSGNYSHRFYETLCCGKIPVFVNTSCVLPYGFKVEWKKYCVWVEENELSSITKKVMEFHAALSPQDYVDLQHECRKLWIKWLSPEGFFANMYKHFQDI